MNIDERKARESELAKLDEKSTMSTKKLTRGNTEPNARTLKKSEGYVPWGRRRTCVAMTTAWLVRKAIEGKISYGSSWIVKRDG